MEMIRGKTSLMIDVAALASRRTGYAHTLLDLGTGDGRYVRTLAVLNPDWFLIGIDACRENLHANSQVKLPNALYLIASAQTLPNELAGIADRMTINFPWGSLLSSLLEDVPALTGGLAALARPGAGLEIRLNGEALLEAGFNLADGVDKVRAALSGNGFRVAKTAVMGPAELKGFPSTWARRLAFGRDPRAVLLTATAG